MYKIFRYAYILAQRKLRLEFCLRIETMRNSVPSRPHQRNSEVLSPDRHGERTNSVFTKTAEASKHQNLWTMPTIT